MGVFEVWMGLWAGLGEGFKVWNIQCCTTMCVCV